MVNSIRIGCDVNVIRWNWWKVYLTFDFIKFEYMLYTEWYIDLVYELIKTSRVDVGTCYVTHWLFYQKNFKFHSITKNHQTYGAIIQKNTKISSEKGSVL